MPNTIQAAGEAMPIETYSGNWQKAKALGKELSEVLEQLGDTGFAYIRPSSKEFPVCFGGSDHAEAPVDRVERLSRELSEALPQWADGMFMAMVYPQGDSRGHWFRNIRAYKNDASIEAKNRLSEITTEAVKLIAANPDLMIDAITVNKIGVYTSLDITGGRADQPDPLLDTIQEFNAGAAALNSLPLGTITSDNEDQLVSDTYGPSMDRLLQWDAPALSVEGAIAAMKLMEEQDVFGDEMGKSMCRAVLGFLEGVKA